MYQITTATKKLLNLRKRLKFICGGTSAGKTISILMILIDKAQTNPNFKIDVMSESYPHLEDGAIKDFKEIMVDRRYWEDKSWNESKHVYTFPNKAKIKFISVDKLGKAKGPRRDVLFLNEGNHLSWNIVDQLMVRTSGDIWCDWNPTNEFWYYTDIKGIRDHDFITLTYIDNEGLGKSIIEDIESHKGNKSWWQVYGLGQLGEVEGKIYTGWQIISEVPYEARLIARGLDFGYSIDPTVIVEIYEYNQGYIINEILYQKGMGNKSIADFLLGLEEPHIVVRADGAEPKSIDEIYGYGVNIVAAGKGQGSVLQGIKFVQDQKISITKKSIKTLKAYRNYMFMMNNTTGEIIQIPDDTVHEWSNSMDAIRYGFDAANQYRSTITNHKTNY